MLLDNATFMLNHLDQFVDPVITEDGEFIFYLSDEVRITLTPEYAQCDAGVNAYHYIEWKYADDTDLYDFYEMIEAELHFYRYW